VLLERIVPARGAAETEKQVRIMSLTRRIHPAILIAAGLSVVALQIACTNNSSTKPNFGPPVSLSSTPTSLYVNDTLAITATVANDTGNKGVTWSCSPANTCGTFSSSQTANGVAVTYTAPSSTGSVVITATSVATNTLSASTPSITINPASSITVAFNPAAPFSLRANGTTPLTATVANDPNSAGVIWSCTPANTCGSFSASTSSSGSPVTYTAPATTETVTITASSITDDAQGTSATIGITSVVATTLAAGNYVFSLTGTDKNGSFYTTAGVFVVSSAGAITGGEQDFADFNHVVSQEPITGGSITSGADGNLTISLNFTDSYINNGSGTDTFDASLISSSNALLTEYDDWATSSGTLEAQTAQVFSPAGAYALSTSGWDTNQKPISIGGVINVDSIGGISGKGSILDRNDDGTLTPEITVSKSSVSAPDAFGFVTFAINSSSVPGSNGTGILWDGYIVDSSHIRLVEDWYHDNLGAITGGTALSQGTNTGSFGSSSISGSTYVVGLSGSDTVSGPLQVAAVLTFNSDGSVTGNLSFNDITAQAPQGGTALSAESTTTPCSSGMAVTACYVLDAAGSGSDGGTGRVTIKNLTDGSTFSYNLELYLSGNGEAEVISMDSNNPYNNGSKDILAGLSLQQTSTSLSAGSISGSYALNFGQFNTSKQEADGVGAVSADGVGTLLGFADQNASLSGGTLTADSPLSYTFAVTPTNGVFNVTGSGTNGKTFTSYFADRTRGIIIENDNSQLTLGSFDLQQ